MGKFKQFLVKLSALGVHGLVWEHILGLENTPNPLEGGGVAHSIFSKLWDEATYGLAYVCRLAVYQYLMYDCYPKSF